MPKTEHRFIYRDKQTGQMVNKETWTRSKSQGGTRYVRVIVEDEVATYDDLFEEIDEDDPDYEELELGGGISYE